MIDTHKAAQLTYTTWCVWTQVCTLGPSGHSAINISLSFKSFYSILFTYLFMCLFINFPLASFIYYFMGAKTINITAKV